MSMPELTAKQEWKSGWTLVLAASLGFSFFSIMLAAVGLFMEPLGKEFGWSRTLLSAGPSIATTITAILGPGIGVLVDRYGARRIVLPGLILTAAIITAFSTLNGSQTQWLFLWAVFGFLSVSIKSTPWTAAVVGLFQKSRGLALGLTLSGTAVAGAIVPPLANYLITAMGWRSAFIWLALGWGGVTFVICLLLFFDVRDRLARTRSRSENEEAQASAPIVLPGLSIRQAWRSWALWRVAVSNFVIMVLSMGLTVHLFPILTEAGVSRTSAAFLTSLSGLAGIAGKILTGIALDHFRPNLVGGITLGAAGLAFALLNQDVHSPALIVIALLVNGYAFGTKTHITSYLTAGYGGMKNFGAIYGIMSSLMALASGLGPLLAGWIYDTAGGYGPFLLIGTVGCILGGLIIMTMPPYPQFGGDETPDIASKRITSA